MKTSDSHQQSHISNTRSEQPFFGAAPEQAFFAKERSRPEPFFKPAVRSSIPIQTKLAVGAAGDHYEQEADRVAAQVVDRINSPSVQQTENHPSVQRVGKEDELQREVDPEEDALQMKSFLQREVEPEEDAELQMHPISTTIQRVGTDGEDLQRAVEQDITKGGMASPDLETSIQQSRGSGQPIAEQVREPMEQAFGADFSGVRVHTDAQSDQLNQSIQAKAFTTGQDIFFRQGAYQPSNRGGQELIAHELTHVVQQGSEARGKNGEVPPHREESGLSSSAGQRAHQQKKESIERGQMASDRPEEGTVQRASYVIPTGNDGGKSLFTDRDRKYAKNPLEYRPLDNLNELIDGEVLHIFAHGTESGKSAGGIRPKQMFEHLLSKSGGKVKDVPTRIYLHVCYSEAYSQNLARIIQERRKAFELTGEVEVIGTEKETITDSTGQDYEVTAEAATKLNQVRGSVNDTKERNELLQEGKIKVLTPSESTPEAKIAMYPKWKIWHDKVIEDLKKRKAVIDNEYETLQEKMKGLPDPDDMEGLAQEEIGAMEREIEECNNEIKRSLEELSELNNRIKLEEITKDNADKEHKRAMEAAQRNASSTEQSLELSDSDEDTDAVFNQFQNIQNSFKSEKVKSVSKESDTGNADNAGKVESEKTAESALNTSNTSNTEQDLNEDIDALFSNFQNNLKSENVNNMNEEHLTDNSVDLEGENFDNRLLIASNNNDKDFKGEGKFGEVINLDDLDDFFA